MKIILTLVLSVLVMQGNAQVAISNSASAPDASAMLDVSSTNKGMLVPRIRLSNLNTGYPVASPATGLLVYNAADTVYGPNGYDYTAQGLYTWTGTIWNRMSTASEGAVPKDALLKFENKQAHSGYTYNGYEISNYYAAIGTGTGGWTSIPAISTGYASAYASSAYYSGKLYVWSGEDNTYASYDSSGAYYTVSSNTWTSMPLLNAPTGRYGGVTVTDAANGYMIVWGGVKYLTTAATVVVPTNTGGVYNMSTNTWSASAMPTGTLAARTGHTAVWTGTKMLVWGGWDGNSINYADGAAYTRSTNTWTAMAACPLAARHGHTAVWTGSKMIIYGGTNGTTYYNDGASYDPAGNTWTMIANNGLAYYPTYNHSAVWTGTDMIVFGGVTSYGSTAACYRYSLAGNNWNVTSTAPGAQYTATCVSEHLALWTGSEMIIVGGKTGLGGTATLVRSYLPATDTWLLYNNMPAGRRGMAGAWTASEIVLQGGETSGYSNYATDGARFNPATGTPQDIEVYASRVFYLYKKN